jgi:polyhydroxyalkanoate synthesis regulator phasin
MKHLQLSLSVALVTSLSLPANSALAADSPPAASAPASSAPAAVTPAPAAAATNLFSPSISDVDARYALLEKRLNDGYSAGRLEQAQYEKYRLEMKRVADQEAVFRASDGNLSLWENLRLQFELDRIMKEIEMSFTDRKTGSIDVVARRDEIKGRLAYAYMQGRLTKQEHDTIELTLNHLTRQIDAARGKNGQIGIADGIKLLMALDRLSQTLATTVHDRQISLTTIDGRQAEIAKRIKTAGASGKLTSEQVKALIGQLHTITDREDALRRLARPLTADEQLSLAFDLEKINGQIDAEYMDSDLVDMDTARVSKKEGDIDRIIAQALFKGIISTGDGQNYKQQLDRIIVKDKTFRAAGGDTLDALQAQNLLIELEALSGSIDRSIYNKQPVWPGVEASIPAVRLRIEQAKGAGRLEEPDSAALEAELTRINGLKDEALANGLSASAVVSMAAALDQLDESVARTVKDRTISFIPDIDKRKTEINHRIADGIASGKLTLEEARSLLDELNRISTQQAQLKANDSVLDEREKLSLALDLERLATNTEKEIRDNPFVSKSIEELKKQADQDIASGTLSGKLTAVEVQSLRGELNRISTYETTSLVSDGSLDAKEAIILVSDLTKLIKDVDVASKNGNGALPDIAKRQAEIYQRITEGVMQGRLSTKSADNLKRDFYRIMDQDAKYRAAGGMSFGEQASLALELEKLASNIEASMGETQAALPDVDQKQADLDNELAGAVASGQLSPAQAQEFSTELDRIASEENAFRFSGSGLSYSESLALITELEKLSGRIDTALAGQKPQWSGIDGRISELGKRISDGQSASKFNAGTASQLSRELDRITQAEQAFIASGGGLSLAEVESLSRDLDRLTRDLEVRLGIGSIVTWTDIDGRQARIESTIAQSSASGKISPSVASRAKRELQALSAVKSSWKTSGGSYSYTQLVTMAQTLDKIDKMLGIRSSGSGRPQAQAQ